MPDVASDVMSDVMSLVVPAVVFYDVPDAVYEVMSGDVSAVVSYGAFQFVSVIVSANVCPFDRVSDSCNISLMLDLERVFVLYLLDDVTK